MRSIPQGLAVLLGAPAMKSTLTSLPMVGGEAFVPVMGVTPNIVVNYGCLGWVMERPVPLLCRVARTVQLKTLGGLQHDVATTRKRGILMRAPLDKSFIDPVSMAHSSRIPYGKELRT